MNREKKLSTFTFTLVKEATIGNLHKFNLTERELEVLKLLKQSKSNSEIAKILFMSVHTAKAHVGNIFSKLNVHDRVGAVVKAIQEKIIEL